jgi:streptogramin lyase
MAAQIATFAGTGVRGFSGDGGLASAAQLNNPSAIVRGPDGALYVCDTDNQRIRRISRDGIISTFAGNGSRGYSGDGGPAAAAALNEPYEGRFDAAGNFYFVERLNHVVRRIDAKSGSISTFAGTGRKGFSGDGGPAEKAQMHDPHSLVFGNAGDLYICDIGNHRVRKIEVKSGVISTLTGTGEKKPTPDEAPLAGTALSGPRALDRGPGGELWLALREGNALLRLDLAAGVMRRIAGSGRAGFTGNGGPALGATLSGPKCVSVAANGDVYFADTESHSIRMFDAKRGTIELVAGTGAKGDGPDGDPLRCELSRPHGVFVDADGSIFIGDSDCHRVRVLRK